MPSIGIGLATLIASGIGTGGALAASKMSSNASKSVAAQQLAAATPAEQRAQELFDIAKPGYQKASDYYSGLLSGDPAQFTAAASPEINATNAQFNAARQNIINNSYSRSGGLDAGLNNLEAGRASTLSNIFGNIRPLAASGLSNLAGTASGSSTSNFDAALAALGGAQQSTAQNTMLQSQAMSGFGNFLTQLLGGGFSTKSNVPQTIAPPSATVSPAELRYSVG